MDNVMTCSSSNDRQRTRFFPRQLITPDDLSQNAVYFREAQRRHNRMLHGWGVVCGVRVRANEATCEVVVEPGYVLGPYGDEIIIDQEVTVDVCHQDLDGNAFSGCSGSNDPWCCDIRVGRQPGQTLYLAVRYAECQTRPIRVQANGCGCDETACEYSRVADSYVLRVLTELPESYQDPMQPPSGDNIVRCSPADRERGRGCTPCPPAPWVILADIRLGDDENIEEVDCFAHRRYVATFADFYFVCGEQEVRDEVVVARPVGQPGVDTVASDTLVAVQPPDGGRVFMPANFAVESGETVATFLAREGGRTYEDPSSGRTFSLAEVIGTNIDSGQVLNSMADVTALLNR